jgi:hypothetical protein
MLNPMNKKGFAPIVVLLVIAGVLLVGGIWYYEIHTSANLTSTQSQPASASTSSVSGNVGWQMYSNPQLGISFAYPPDGSVKVGQFSLPYATVPPFVPYPTIIVALPFLTNPHPEDWTGKSLYIAFHYNDSCSNWGLGKYSTSTQKTVNNTTYRFQDPSVVDTSGMSAISKERIYYGQSATGCVVIMEQLTGYGPNEGPAPATMFSPEQENAFIATEMATIDDMVSTLRLEW